MLSLLAADPALWEQLTLKPEPADFSEGTMREIAGAALALASERLLDPSRLIELGAGRTARGQPVQDMLARGSMKLEDTFGRQSLINAVNEQLRRQRLYRLRQEQERLNQEQTLAEDPVRRQEAKQALLEVTQQLIALKQSSP